MAERMTTISTSESCWPSKREAFNLGYTIGHLQATVDIHKAQKQPAPKSGVWGMADSLKNLIGYFTAAHKLVLLWRAISMGYIGRELLRWLGWL